MALVWWAAHKLTWDCTHIDEKKIGAGRGLLSAAGLDTDAKETPETPVSSDPKGSTPAEGEKKPAWYLARDRFKASPLYP